MDKAACFSWALDVSTQANEQVVSIVLKLILLVCNIAITNAGKTLRAPAEFLRSRLRADGGAKILAPIRASRIKLQAAEKALATINIYDPSPDTYKNILQQIRSASMNCYSFDVGVLLCPPQM